MAQRLAEWGTRKKLLPCTPGMPMYKGLSTREVFEQHLPYPKRRVHRTFSLVTGGREEIIALL